MLLARLLSRLIKRGELVIVDAHGRPHALGGAPIPGIPPVTIRLHDPALHWRLALRPGLVAGEAWMDGTLTVERGSLRDFLALACANIAEHDREHAGPHPFWRLARLVQQHNPAHRSRRNVAHHYDLSGELYSLFLDADSQYSCAYFPHPGASLEEAQAAKKRHIAAKLLLADGQRVLDIGCGWGGLALELARHARVEVLGVTLSTEQLEVARRRAAEAGLADRVRFELVDWRELSGPFDRVVSVGMFEHVGVNHYDSFFRTVSGLLAPDGVALIHSIGRMDGPGTTNAWLRKYIFPGGYSPALSEVLPAMEDAGLLLNDLEILRLHYAETLLEWQRRLEAHRDRVVELYDERFLRMFQFYLAGCEMAFRHQGHMVWQAQLTRSLTAVPLTRDYMLDTERAMAAAERRAAE